MRNTAILLGACAAVIFASVLWLTLCRTQAERLLDLRAHVTVAPGVVSSTDRDTLLLINCDRWLFATGDTTSWEALAGAARAPWSLGWPARLSADAALFLAGAAGGVGAAAAVAWFTLRRLPQRPSAARAWFAALAGVAAACAVFWLLYQRRQPGYPLYTWLTSFGAAEAVAMSAAGGAWALACWLPRAVLVRERPGRCPSCGYATTGLPRCPECGHVVGVGAPPPLMRLRSVRIAAVAAGALVLAVGAAIGWYIGQPAPKPPSAELVWRWVTLKPLNYDSQYQRWL